MQISALAQELSESLERTVDQEEVALYLRWAVRRLFKAVRALLESDTARELGLEHLVGENEFFFSIHTKNCELFLSAQIDSKIRTRYSHIFITTFMLTL